MNSVCIEDVLVDKNDDVILKIKPNSSNEVIYVAVDRDEGVYISELLLHIDRDNKYTNIYDLYLNSIHERNLEIYNISVVITETENYANISLIGDNGEIYENDNINVGTAIILGLKTEKPISLREHKSKDINICELKPTDFKL